ncbi:MAG: HAD family phosphatase [Paludibacter sp.]|nr:HAD family phosphatase [Paludibacter sp.]
MKQFRNITTLIFDFGGVLINLDLPQCIQNIQKLGFEKVDEFLSNFGQSDFFLKYEKGQIDTPEFRENIRKYTSLDVTDEQIDAAWCSFLCDIPREKIDLLLDLRKKYRLFLLSNTNPLHIDVSGGGEFAKVGLTYNDVFERCYFSYKMGLAKPDPAIFKALLADAGVQSKECLFLDDGQKNIDTAASLGFQTYLVAPHEDLSFLREL